MKNFLIAFFLFASTGLVAQEAATKESYSLGILATAGGAVRATSEGSSNGPVFAGGLLYRNYEDALSFGLAVGYTSWQAQGQVAQRRHYFRGEMGKPLSPFVTFNLGVSAFASRDAGFVQMSIGPRIYFHLFEKKNSSLLIMLDGGFGGVNYVGANVGYCYSLKGR